MGCLLIIIGLILLDNPDSNMQCLGVILILVGLFGSTSSSTTRRVIRRERVDLHGNVVSTETIDADDNEDEDEDEDEEDEEDNSSSGGGGLRLDTRK
jgi:phosphopantothenoylcysteine synthetase/decarboxylase